MFYTEQVTAAAAQVSLSLEDNWASGPPFRLVLPRDKRDRLAERAIGLRLPRGCSVAGCRAEIQISSARISFGVSFG